MLILWAVLYIIRSVRLLFGSAVFSDLDLDGDATFLSRQTFVSAVLSGYYYQFVILLGILRPCGLQCHSLLCLIPEGSHLLHRLVHFKVLMLMTSNVSAQGKKRENKISVPSTESDEMLGLQSYSYSITHQASTQLWSTSTPRVFVSENGRCVMGSVAL